jgi:hypothetical protein
MLMDRSKTNIRQKETKLLVWGRGQRLFFFKFDTIEKQSNLNVDLRQLENSSEKSGIR